MRFFERDGLFACKDIYKKKAAAAPRPAKAGTTVINGAAPVAVGAGEDVLDAAEAADCSEPEVVGLPDLDAEDAGDAEEDTEPVTEALLADGVAAAEALGSKSSPAVTTNSAMFT